MNTTVNVVKPSEDVRKTVPKEDEQYVYGQVSAELHPDNKKLPFPLRVMQRKRWYERSTHEEQALEFALEEERSQIMASAGYGVTEEMSAELNKTFEEQKEHQERFKHELRFSWQQPCANGRLCCCRRQMFTSNEHFQN